MAAIFANQRDAISSCDMQIKLIQQRLAAIAEAKLFRSQELLTLVPRISEIDIDAPFVQRLLNPLRAFKITLKPFLLGKPFFRHFFSVSAHFGVFRASFRKASLFSSVDPIDFQSSDLSFLILPGFIGFLLFLRQQGSVVAVIARDFTDTLFVFIQFVDRANGAIEKEAVERSAGRFRGKN